MKSSHLSTLPTDRSNVLAPATDRVGGGGASRVAASGPRPATKEPGGERRGPAPTRLHPGRGLDSRLSLRASPQPPTEPTTTLRHRQSPHAGLLALELVPPAALIGLMYGLPADSQCVSDLGPGSALATGRGRQQISYICQRVLGVSHLSQGVQRSLRATQSPRQILDHRPGPHPRMSALVGAHVNGYCRSAPTVIRAIASIPIGGSICDTLFPNLPYSRVGSRSNDYSRVRYRTTTKKKRPRAAPTAGVVADIRGN